MAAGYECECRGLTFVKGKGNLVTYFVKTPFDGKLQNFCFKILIFNVLYEAEEEAKENRKHPKKKSEKTNINNNYIIKMYNIKEAHKLQQKHNEN